jgi:hypothetical protein
MHRGDDLTEASLFSFAISTLSRSRSYGPTPLDLPPSLDAYQNILQIRTAYLRVFELDQRVSDAGGANPDICEDRLVPIRFLGHLIRETPSILVKLYQLDKMYLHHYIRDCESPSLLLLL